jgi:autotransporter adhesin
LYTVTTGVNQIATYTANYFGGGSTYNTTTGDISAPTYQVIGGSVTNVGDAITNIITQGPLQYSDAAGNPNPYVVSNDVTLVGTAPGALVTIHNLAAGVADTDAVNVSQLNSTVAASKTHYYSVNDGGTAGGNYNNDGATATGAIASGVGTTATAVNATAIGSGATANTANSVALGAGSTTSAIHTGQTGLFGGTAAGVATAANGTVSVGTVGGERQVQNVAAGVVSSTSTDAVNGSQLYTVASGVTQLGNSTANYFGGGSTYNSVTGAISAPTYQVIGGSVTNVGDAITNIITQGPVQYSDAAGTPTPYTPSNNVTLVGLAPGDLVTVHNVAAGVAGTDAVNVSQLSTAVADAKTKYVGINSTGGSNVNGEGASGMDAIATGKDAVASATNAVAIGLGATASTANSVALGAGSTTGTVHTGTLAMYGGTAAGVGSDTYGVVSVGTAGAPRQIQNVAAGVISGTSTDAINGSQLYSVTTGVNNLGSSTATALGGGSTYNSVLGTVSAPTYQVIGGTATTVGAAITNIITQGPVQYADATGAATPYTPSNTVTLVGATADPVTLTNVAPGAISPTSTDAVNGSQLYATNYYISAVDNRVTMVDNRVTQVDNRVTVLDNQTVKYDLYQDGSTNYNSVTLGGGKSSGPVGLHNVADGVAPTDAVNVSQLNAQGKKIYGAVAAAAALESAPYIPGKLTSAAGIATAGGQSAIGISIRKTADNARWSLSAGLAYSPGVSKTPVARAAITNIWD